MMIFTLILIITILLISLLMAMYSTLFERKIAGFFQDRFGPDRAGPFGLLQPLADWI
jgi:NADH-quinone oxidoreductase subunit H